MKRVEIRHKRLALRKQLWHPGMSVPADMLPWLPHKQVMPEEQPADLAQRRNPWLLPQAVPANPPVIVSPIETTFTLGQSNSFQFVATGTPPIQWTETGSLPSGITLTLGGHLSGTPAAATEGDYPIVVTAKNGFQSQGTQNFVLHVIDAPGPTTLINFMRSFPRGFRPAARKAGRRGMWR